MNRTDRLTRLRDLLASPDVQTRLQAAMAAGTRPAVGQVEVLVARCAVEPDFFVRDTLTWALTRHEQPLIMELLLDELASPVPQARSQALHTLSKLGDARAWPAITADLLRDPDDEVARAAWRTAAGLVPDDSRAELAEELASQFNRGGRDVQLSLSRAMAVLGEAALPVVQRAQTAKDPGVSAHAVATERLMQDPEEGFDAAIAEAERVVALRGAPG